MRPLRFLGDSLKCLRDFPEGARHDAGYQLDKVQRGGDEIRVSDSSGAYRVVPQRNTGDAKKGFGNRERTI